MIIHDFHIVSVLSVPGKTYPPLGIDAYAVLPLTTSFECFQAVVRWHTKVFKTISTVYNHKLHKGFFPKFRRELGLLTVPQLGSDFPFE